MIENLQSPHCNTFDKDNCDSLGEYGSSVFNYYDPQHNLAVVEQWSHCVRFVRQFDIKIAPAIKSTVHPVSLVPESTKRAFRNITATYKRLFRMYLESITTSWKLLLKLVSTLKKATHEKFVTNGRALLQQIKEQLNRVTLWYGNLKLPIAGYSCCELDQFMGICESGLYELHESKEQVNCLLM